MEPQTANFTPIRLSTDALPERIPPNSEALQYILGYIRFLGEQQTLTDPALARTVAIHLRDLFALALGAKREAAVVAADRGLRAARLQAIKRFISDNLNDGGLNVGAVAVRHRVSPRYVQLLFAREGTTFSEFVLNQRLARARNAE